MLLFAPHVLLTCLYRHGAAPRTPENNSAILLDLQVAKPSILIQRRAVFGYPANLT